MHQTSRSAFRFMANVPPATEAYRSVVTLESRAQLQAHISALWGSLVPVEIESIKERSVVPREYARDADPYATWRWCVWGRDSRGTTFPCGWTDAEVREEASPDGQ